MPYNNPQRPDKSTLKQVYAWAGSIKTAKKAKSSRENLANASLIRAKANAKRKAHILRGINYAKIEKIALPDVKLF